MNTADHDEMFDQAEDRDFYRDSFGERITREGEDSLPGEEDTLAADDSSVMDEDEANMDGDEDFRERLDQSKTSSGLGDEEAASIDQPEGTKSTSTHEKSMGDKIRDKFHDLSGDDDRR